VEGLTRLIDSMKTASYQLQVERSAHSIKCVSLVHCLQATESARVHYAQEMLIDNVM